MEKNYQELRVNFLKKFVLGQKTDLSEPDEVIKKCISLAYKDMMTAGKYYLDSDKNKGDKEKTRANKVRENDFYALLERRNFVFSRALIEETCAIFGDDEIIENSKSYVTRYGLAQKLVNMTYKYFFVFSDEIHRVIDFSDCDCPLDSIIIGRLGRSDIWSKLGQETYLTLQTEINNIACNYDEYPKLGRLAYDFRNW